MPPSVPPRLEPSELKKPLGREALARVLSSSAGMPSAAEKIGVHAEEAGEALQRGHLALEGGVAEGQLILLRLIPCRNALLARKVVGKIGEAGGVARARGAICGGLLQRIESAGQRALRLRGDRGLVGGTKARITGNALELRHERVAELLLIAEKLLVQRIDAGELLVGELLRCYLSATAHDSLLGNENRIRESKSETRMR